VTEEQLRTWMDAYGVAFKEQDADAAAALFTPDSTYQWGPFGETLLGPDEIRGKWEQVSDPPANPVTFHYEVIAVTDAVGVVRWLATHSYPEDGKRFRYDGIFEVALDGDRLCTSFREWWNTREEPLDR
jgi:ketosteroid isomerase-like protein